MKPFMDKDFLLSTPTAQKLYHEYAADMPIKMCIRDRSSEVWDVLSSVKSEFETFGTALELSLIHI